MPATENISSEKTNGFAIMNKKSTESEVYLCFMAGLFNEIVVCPLVAQSGRWECCSVYCARHKNNSLSTPLL